MSERFDGGTPMYDCLDLGVCAWCGTSYPFRGRGFLGWDYCSSVCLDAATEEAAEEARHQAARDRDREPDRWPTPRPTRSEETRFYLTALGEAYLLGLRDGREGRR